MVALKISKLFDVSFFISMIFVVIFNFLLFNEKHPQTIFYIFLGSSIAGTILFVKKLYNFDEYVKKYR